MLYATFKTQVPMFFDFITVKLPVNAWYYEHYGGILSSAGVHMLNNLVSYLMM